MITNSLNGIIKKLAGLLFREALHHVVAATNHLNGLVTIPVESSDPDFIEVFRILSAFMALGLGSSVCFHA